LKVESAETKEVAVPNAAGENLLEIILDSWDRNNRILVNLLRALPPGGLEITAMAGGRSVAEIFTHIHYVRLVFLSEDAPEFATEVPAREWLKEDNPNLIAEQLDRSAKAVRDAVEICIQRGQEMKLHYDHPLFYVQHMIWHEGYHHGQIKLALKIAGHPLDDEEIGPLTWDIWMDKSPLRTRA
jgi:uncharacterized damage-inducible protein DinB